MSSRILGSFFSAEDVGGGENCTICRSKLDETDVIGKINCGHSFCFECISMWCATSSTCCSCRASVSEIRKMQRLPIAKAIEFQELRKAIHSKLRSARSATETEMVPLPILSSSSSSSSSSTVAILVDISFIHRQVQRAVSDEDELLAIRIQLEEEGGEEAAEADPDVDVGLVDSSPADACSVCRDGGLLVLCDSCSSLWHLGCVAPPLPSVPEGLWICGLCEKDFLDLKFESKAAFVRERQIKLSTAAVLSAISEKQDKQEDEDEGPVVPVRRGRALAPFSASASASSSSSSSSSESKKRKSSKKSEGRRMKGYKKDGFVVPVDSDDEC